ncbi:MAG: NTF2 fold immunity protein, partial [Nitrospiraceae bacterium]
MKGRTFRSNVFCPCFIVVLCIVPAIAGYVLAEDTQEKHSVSPRDGFVPDKETAIRIAEAVLIPIYGKENIERQRPFNATQIQGVWIVEGTLPADAMVGG